MATIPIPTIAGRQLARPGRRNLETVRESSGLGELTRGLQSVGDGMDRRQAYADEEAEKRKREADKEEQNQERARNAERMSSTRLEWTQYVTDRKTEAPEGAEGFTAAIGKDLDERRDKVLNSVKAGRERDQLRGLLMDTQDRLKFEAMAFEGKSKQAFRFRVLGEGTEQDAKAIALAPQQFQDVLAQRLMLINTSRDLDAESKGKLIEQAKERLAMQAGLSIIDKPGGPEAFLARTGTTGGKAGKGGKTVPATDGAPGMADPIINSLSDTGLRTLIDRATTMKVQRDSLAAAESERRMRLAEMAAAKRDREATHAQTLLGGFFRDGLTPDLSDPVNAKAVEAINAVPALSAWYRQQMTDAPKRVAAAMQPIAAQREQLSQLQQRAEAKGTSKALDDEITFRKQALTAAESAFQKDPLQAFGERFPQARAQPLDTSSPQALEASLSLRRPLVDAAKQFSGTQQVSPLLDHEAPAIKATIETLPEKERSAYIARLARAAGPQGATAIANQLDKNDKALGLAFKAGADATQAGQYRSEFILRGQKAMADKTVLKDSTAVAGWQASIAAEVDRLNLPNAKASEDIKAAAGYTVAALAAERGGSAGRSEIARAVQIAAGGTIVEQGDGHILLPDGVTQNQLTQRLRSMTPAQMLAMKPGAQPRPLGAADEMVRAGPAFFPLAELIKSLPGARLVTVGQGRYSIMTVREDGTSDRPVTTMDGENIVIGLQ